MYSQTALKIYATKREGVIKSNAGFWRDFGGGKIIDSLSLPLAKYAKAAEYGAMRYVMYNEATDSGNPLFGLNRQLLENNALILTQNVF